MSTKTISRRRFLHMSGLAAGAALLAACAPAAEGKKTPAAASVPLSDQAITIVMWNSDWGKDYNDPMYRLNDAFIKDVMPKAKIDITFMPSLTEKLAAAIAGGNPPDCAVIDEGYGVPKMARANGLISLKDYYDRDGVKAEDFIPFTWETVLYKGVPYGIPGGAGTIILEYGKEALKDAGIDPNSIPDTPKLEEFMEWNQRVVKKDSSGKVTRIGLMPETWAFHQWAGILGATYYNADKTKITINSPETVKAVETYASFMPQGISFDEVSSFLSGAPTSGNSPIGSGMAAWSVDGFWAYLAMDKYWPKLDYGMCKLPTPKGTKEDWKLYTGWVWDPSIPKGAKQPEAAWAFMKYGYWDHGAMLADTLNWTSAVKQFPEFEKRTIALMGENNREKPYLHHFTEAQYAGAYFVPYTPVYQKLTDSINQAVDAVIRGQKKAQEALDEVVNTVQPELDKALAEG